MAKAKLGSGARFKSLTKKLDANPKIKNPKVVAAAIGWKKYGAKMGKMAAKGRKKSK